MITRPDPEWRLELAHEPRTTHAGRIALPIALSAHGEMLAVVDLVLDGSTATRLHAALTAHLSGHGTGPSPAGRSRAHLLEPCAAGAVR